jgi:TatD DNase family protein
MPQLFPALGLHPLSIAKHKRAIGAFRRLAASADFIGEIGLDFSREGIGSRRDQEETFDAVLTAIAGRHRFTTLHSRGAEKEVLDALSRHKIGGAVFHWFSGSVARADEIASAGHYFSINPAMLRTQKIGLLLPVIPRDRVLAETDGPHVMIGERAVSPKEVVQVYLFLAQQWRVSFEEVKTQLAANFWKACDSR